MQHSKRIVFVGKEVDWTKPRAGLRTHSESEERDKISVKKEGTTDSRSHLYRVPCDAVGERGSTVQTRKQTVGGELC